MARAIPHSVLFCCDHNAVRSPMAEGIMKKFYGTEVYVQSAGVMSELEIDGFSIAVCAEIGVELSRHRTRNFDEMHRWGDELSSFDLVVALSQASMEAVDRLPGRHNVELVHWPVSDPTGREGGREDRLAAYREARDDIVARLVERWGTPADGAAGA